MDLYGCRRFTGVDLYRFQEWECHGTLDSTKAPKSPRRSAGSPIRTAISVNEGLPVQGNGTSFINVRKKDFSSFFFSSPTTLLLPRFDPVTDGGRNGGNAVSIQSECKIHPVDSDPLQLTKQSPVCVDPKTKGSSYPS